MVLSLGQRDGLAHAVNRETGERHDADKRRGQLQMPKVSIYRIPLLTDQTHGLFQKRIGRLRYPRQDQHHHPLRRRRLLLATRLHL